MAVDDRDQFAGAADDTPRASPPSWDKQVVDAAIEGCPRLWTTLVNETYRTVRSAVRSRAKYLRARGYPITQQLEQEAFQHVYLDLLDRGFERFQGSGSLRGFVRRVAERRALDYFQRETRYRWWLYLRDVEEATAPDGEPSMSLEQVHYRHDFEKVVQEAGLTERERLILRLRVEEGLDPRDIAPIATKELGRPITPQNVAATLTRVRTKIAAYLSRHGGN